MNKALKYINVRNIIRLNAIIYLSIYAYPLPAVLFFGLAYSAHIILGDNGCNNGTISKTTIKGAILFTIYKIMMVVMMMAEFKTSGTYMTSFVIGWPILFIFFDGTGAYEEPND